MLAVATAPAVIAGLLLEDAVATVFRSPTFAAIGFLLTAAILLAGERIGRASHASMKAVGPVQAIAIGLAQAFAILPGVSRSGCTISMGRALGLGRASALDFSFLMAVPIIGGAVAKTLLDALSGDVVFPPLAISLTGFIASFAVSMLAIGLLKKFVAVRSLAWFAVYLIPLAVWLLLDEWQAAIFIDREHLTEYVQHYGAIAVFFFAFLENVPPFGMLSPGVVLLVIAGSLVASPLAGALFFIAAAAGVSCGNVLMYQLGERYGRDIAHRFHLTEDRLKRVDRFMARFGRLSVVFGQFVGFLRPAIAFVAGTAKMPHTTYLPAMLLSAVAWAAFYLILGFVLRTNVVWAASVVGLWGFVVLPLAAAAIGLWKWRTRKHGSSKPS